MLRPAGRRRRRCVSRSGLDVRGDSHISVRDASAGTRGRNPDATRVDAAFPHEADIALRRHVRAKYIGVDRCRDRKIRGIVLGAAGGVAAWRTGLVSSRAHRFASRASRLRFVSFAKSAARVRRRRSIVLATAFLALRAAF